MIFSAKHLIIITANFLTYHQISATQHGDHFHQIYLVNYLCLLGSSLRSWQLDQEISACTTGLNNIGSFQLTRLTSPSLHSQLKVRFLGAKIVFLSLSWIFAEANEMKASQTATWPTCMASYHGGSPRLPRQ